MPAVPNEPSEFVQRIPIPPDVEEVDVKRRISVPGKPVQWITVKQWRQRKGKPMVFTDPASPDGDYSVTTTAHKEGDKIIVDSVEVVKPEQTITAKQITDELIEKGGFKPVKPSGRERGVLPKLKKIAKKRVFNQQPVGARQHGAAPRCSFCGGGMASEIGTIHARCQEAKDRIAGRK